jgi:16S rRNA (cytosine1402-N4)-methyltransferase
MRSEQSKLKLHEPVLKDEAIDALGVEDKAHLKRYPKFIDATVGLGGHTKTIVKMGGNVLGIDADKHSLEIAEEGLEKACPSHLSRKVGQFKLVHGNFKDIEKIAREVGYEQVEGILFDLGISTFQFGMESRGFSFTYKNTPLDMRIDKDTQSVKGADLLNVLNKTQLSNLFQVVLPVGLSRKLVSEIMSKREFAKIKTTGDFLEIIEKIIGKRRIRGLHPATLPFLALRIAVNSEIENLKESLPLAFGLLIKKGRLVVISFHSGEDVVVKKFFKEKVKEGEGNMIYKKPVTPSQNEIKRNPSARSAKMRVLEKI